jgi:hypothetical protein
LAFPIGPTHAVEQTFSCNLVTGTDRLRFSQSDQFTVDVDAGRAELRVARTMGTSELVNWTFETKKDALSDDRFSVKSTGDGRSSGEASTALARRRSNSWPMER